jgi:hypothetical protein
MDLIQATKILKEKERKREQLLGQKSMLVDRLKEMGFNTIKEAKDELAEKEKKLQKMKKKYKEGEERFITKFAHLLED